MTFDICLILIVNNRTEGASPKLCNILETTLYNYHGSVVIHNSKTGKCCLPLIVDL